MATDVKEVVGAWRDPEEEEDDLKKDTASKHSAFALPRISCTSAACNRTDSFVVGNVVSR